MSDGWEIRGSRAQRQRSNRSTVCDSGCGSGRSAERYPRVAASGCNCRTSGRSRLGRCPIGPVFRFRRESIHSLGDDIGDPPSRYRSSCQWHARGRLQNALCCPAHSPDRPTSCDPPPSHRRGPERTRAACPPRLTRHPAGSIRRAGGQVRRETPCSCPSSRHYRHPPELKRARWGLSLPDG